MSVHERTALLDIHDVSRHRNDGLSVFFAIICIVDVFGVFPIVALPKAIIDCGYLGIPMIITVCSLQIYTATLLGKCWLMADNLYPSIHRKDRYPYSALTEFTCGKFVAKCVELLLDLTIFGAGIPNLILASQNVHLLGLRLSNNTFDVSYCYWIVIMGLLLCPILWLGSPKDMKLLCTISVVVVSMVFVLISFCLLFSNTKEIESEDDTFRPDKPLWETMLTSYGIIAFQFDIHPSILTIQVDMDEQRKLPRAVLGGFSATLCMAAIISILASIKYGNLVQPSILETLPTSLALHLAAALVALQLCLTSAVSNSALYQHMEDCLGISRYFNHKRCILRTILTLLAIVLAESVPRFDLVMSLIGKLKISIAIIGPVSPLLYIIKCGTLTGPLVFMLPPFLYIKMLSLCKSNEERMHMETFMKTAYSTDERGSLLMTTKRYSSRFSEEFNLSVNFIHKSKWLIYDKLQIAFCISIIVSSFGMTCLTTYFNVYDVMNFANFSKPCIYNVSASLLYL